MHRRHQRRDTRGVLIATTFLAGAMLLLIVQRTQAADPTPAPSPITFASPQFLVWMDGHMTMNGPVEDKAYWLYTERPDGDGTHFAVPDGIGGVYHYSGVLVAGPFATDTELCPVMLARGITSLQAWPPGQFSPVVTCATLAETTATTADAPPAAPPAGVPQTDLIRLGGAAGGAALIAGGAAGLLRRGRRPGAPSSEQTQTEPPDPCASQADDFEAASLTSRYLGDLLQTNRRLQAVLDREIIRMANVMIPGSVGLDVAALLGGGLAGKLVSVPSRSLLATVAEGVVKDVVKEFAKQGLTAAADKSLGLDVTPFEPGKFGVEGATSSSKTILQDRITEMLKHRATESLFATPSGSKQQLVARLTMLGRHAEETAGPFADALGGILDLYGTGIDAATMIAELEILRVKRDAVLDQTANLEVELESALHEARNARERLDFCRRVNSPDWKP